MGWVSKVSCATVNNGSEHGKERKGLTSVLVDGVCERVRRGSWVCVW